MFPCLAWIDFDNSVRWKLQPTFHFYFLATPPVESNPNSRAKPCCFF